MSLPVWSHVPCRGQGVWAQGGMVSERSCGPREGDMVPGGYGPRQRGVWSQGMVYPTPPSTDI